MNIVCIMSMHSIHCTYCTKSIYILEHMYYYSPFFEARTTGPTNIDRTNVRLRIYVQYTQANCLKFYTSYKDKICTVCTKAPLSIVNIYKKQPLNTPKILCFAHINPHILAIYACAHACQLCRVHKNAQTYNTILVHTNLISYQQILAVYHQNPLIYCLFVQQP